MIKYIQKLAILFLFPISVFADVGISETEDGQGRMTLSGSISSSDYIAFVEKHNMLKREKRATSFVFLNSSGGDVNTAMKLGRYIRKEHFHAVVHENKICASACVFVLAGARVKHIDEGGSVYIHRPFINNDNEFDPVRQKVRYKKIESQIKKYLNEMNISVGLYDEMFSIDSVHSKLLSINELQKYSLIGLDPYVLEANDAKTAKELGITKSELHIRYNRLDKLCNQQHKLFNQAVEETNDLEYQKKTANDYEECSNQVMNGTLK